MSWPQHFPVSPGSWALTPALSQPVLGPAVDEPFTEPIGLGARDRHRMEAPEVKAAGAVGIEHEDFDAPRPRTECDHLGEGPVCLGVVLGPVGVEIDDGDLAGLVNR